MKDWASLDSSPERELKDSPKRKRVDVSRYYRKTHQLLNFDVADYPGLTRLNRSFCRSTVDPSRGIRLIINFT